MVKYVIRRFLELLLALFLIATATFFLTAAAPGDPLVARTMSLPEASRDAIYAKYGLDKPLMERYVITMKGMLQGNLLFMRDRRFRILSGRSFRFPPAWGCSL